jgi:hypothetical protein
VKKREIKKKREGERESDKAMEKMPGSRRFFFISSCEWAMNTGNVHRQRKKNTYTHANRKRSKRMNEWK